MTHALPQAVVCHSRSRMWTGRPWALPSPRPTSCTLPTRPRAATSAGTPLPLLRLFSLYFFILSYLTPSCACAWVRRRSHLRSGEIRKYGPLELEPAATVFSYGQSLFEGLKGTPSTPLDPCRACSCDKLCSGRAWPISVFPPTARLLESNTRSRCCVCATTRLLFAVRAHTKAFRTANNRIVIFRPTENCKRMNEGAARFLMSPIPEGACDHLLRLLLLVPLSLVWDLLCCHG